MRGGDPRRRRSGRSRRRGAWPSSSGSGAPSLRRVLNATGVIVHTNLGRAPLAAAALERVVEVGRGYSNLELDLETGERGSRQDHVAEALRRLTGAEAALVVNNNAAAVLLALAALAEGREVVVSRGELVEIGDGFRIPDVLARSGARMVEVGTTNRTRAADYERAIGPETAALLRVHQSNFRDRRLHRAAVALAELARDRAAAGLPLVDDLGSGSLLDARRRADRRGERRGRSRPRLLLRRQAPRRAAGGHRRRARGPRRAAAAPSAPARAARRQAHARRARGHARAPRGPRAGAAARSRCSGCSTSRSSASARGPSGSPGSIGGEVEETVARVGGGALPLAELPSAACAVEEQLARCCGWASRRSWASSATAASCWTARTLTDDEVDEVARGVVEARGGERPRDGRGRRPRLVMPLTVGTAGHVDHGKTTLVRALTGKDTDRLPEEQARGISIDLGYAPLELPGGRALSLVDVPGHERFVRTMVAGATGIDLFLLVVDAAEGARPQTHEHLAILRLLGVERGVVAVTKADSVDAETLELALEEARELVPGAPVVAVSGVTGEGLDELRGALATSRPAAEQRRADFPARLFVDRVFTLQGDRDGRHGDAVVGRDRGGGQASARTFPPRRARPVASRCTTRPVARAEAGQRVAVNLPGVERSDVRRGDALVAPDAFPRSYRLEVALMELEPIRDGARLSVHHGTSRIPARVVRVGEDHAQLRLAAPVVAARGDRVVLRAETTVGGGSRARPGAASPRRRGARSNARRGRPRLHRPGARPRTGAGRDGRGARASRRRRARRRAGRRPGGRRLGVLRGLARGDGRGGRGAPPRPSRGVAARPRRLRRRAAPGGAVGAEPSSTSCRSSGEGRRPSSRGRRRRSAGAPRPRRRSRPCSTGPGSQRRRSTTPSSRGTSRARAASSGSATGSRSSAGAYEVARDLVSTEAASAGEITLARFRDLAGVGRRDAQLLLERMDADGLTRRIGDRRVLRRAARTSAAPTPAPPSVPTPSAIRLM